ncbi:MAG: electron transfer flavoprotein subunit beta/FixA family protein [bacterium]
MNHEGLQIAVLVSAVHDCLNAVAIEPGGKSIRASSLRWIPNPADTFALEAALRLRGRMPGSRVRAVTMGPPAWERVLRECLAVGADEAVRIWDPAVEESDPHATAVVLATALRGEPADLILAGSRRGDLEHGQVGPMIAEMLGLPLVAAAREILPGQGIRELLVSRRVPGHTLKLSCGLPALLTIEKGPVLRYPKFIDRRKARSLPLRSVELATLGLGASQVGAAGSLTRLERITPPKPSKRSALGSTVSGMSTAARLQRIISGNLQEKKESKVWQCRDRSSVERVVEHMVKEKILSL